MSSRQMMLGASREAARIPHKGNESPMLGNLRPPDSRPRMKMRPRHPLAPPRSQVPVRVTSYFTVKRILDIVFALILMIILAPVVIVTALLVVLTSRGPAFYTQVRLGRFGKPFIIWKLRTMTHGAEEQTGPKWSVPGDNRVTSIGRVLRKLHIDEFPQLVNVLRGDMSLVGPRPERPEFFPVLSAEIPNYARRLLVKPGVTGLAQVYLPPDEDVSGVRRKQLYDLYYIRSISAALDFRLLAATLLQAVGLPHFIVRPLLFLPKPVDIEGRTPPRPTPLELVETVHVTSPEPASQPAS